MEDELYFELRKKNPKSDAKTYRIETVQDILNAVNSENIDKFIHEFEVTLHSAMLLRAINDGLKKEGKVPEDAEIKFTHFDWIDD